MLTTHAPDRAVSYLFAHLDNLPLWGDILQMAVLELIRKVGVHVCVGGGKGGGSGQGGRGRGQWAALGVAHGATPAAHLLAS